MNKENNKVIKRKISLAELYREKQQELTPARQLIDAIAKATGRTEVTIRSWINGKFRPEPLVQKAIAEALDVDVESLFPEQ